MIKRPLFLVLWLFLLPAATAQDTLLLFHPTANNLEVLRNLIDKEIFMPEGCHFLGVFHVREVYRYRQSGDYIEANGLGHLFSLDSVTEELDPQDLFGKNECTAKFRQLFGKSTGAFFMGGPDIPPEVYGEPLHLLTRIADPFRHYMELSYLFHLLGGLQDPGWFPYLEKNSDYVVSGICLGMQTMNVATGGTMIQDIPTELYGLWTVEEIRARPADQIHRNYIRNQGRCSAEPTSYHFHPIRPAQRGWLKGLSGSSAEHGPLVLSSHHQAIEKLGKGWKISATSLDGRIIESIEHERYPAVIGVQFHPEKPGLYDPGILHSAGGGQSISFNSRIRDTGSYGFHLAYWQHLSGLVKGGRDRTGIIRSQ